MPHEAAASQTMRGCWCEMRGKERAKRDTTGGREAPQSTKVGDRACPSEAVSGVVGNWQWVNWLVGVSVCGTFHGAKRL